MGDNLHSLPQQYTHLKTRQRVLLMMIATDPNTKKAFAIYVGVGGDVDRDKNGLSLLLRPLAEFLSLFAPSL